MNIVGKNMRAYTLDEIDELRKVLVNIEENGWSTHDFYFDYLNIIKTNNGGYSYNSKEVKEVAENKLRTYMTSGHTAQDFYDRDKLRLQKIKETHEFKR